MTPDDKQNLRAALAYLQRELRAHDAIVAQRYGRHAYARMRRLKLAVRHRHWLYLTPKGRDVLTKMRSA
jgi:hypothetical protein